MGYPAISSLHQVPSFNHHLRTHTHRILHHLNNIPSILCRSVCIFPLHLYLHRRYNCRRGSGCGRNCKIHIHLGLCTSNLDISENYCLLERLDTPLLFGQDGPWLFFFPTGRPGILYRSLFLEHLVLNMYDILEL